MKLFKNLFFVVAILLFSKQSYSQNQNNTWLFGNHAGLDFNSGIPIAIDGSALYSNEGSSSISDNNGNLLFYTDGITVWNKLNVAMPNGNNLKGNLSTSQGTMIVPMPGSTTHYYIFTIDELGKDMTYSIVDITLAGGLGDVTATKNVFLHPTVSEKQTSVQRCDGNIWVISHQANSTVFYADLITPAGIAPSVLSSLGTSHSGGGGIGTLNTVGQMKISQQGNKLVLAISDTGVFEVFDFDINTGKITHPISIGAGNYPSAYGVEFSPDGSKLYAGQMNTSAVYQFDLTAGSALAIAASAILVAATPGFTSSFQLGTNGKIYIAKSNDRLRGLGYLDVINDPDNMGAACNYISSGVTLGTGLSLLGLPDLMVYASGINGVDITENSTICLGQSITLTASGGRSYLWSGGSTAASITVSPLVKTDYYVSTRSTCVNKTDTISVLVADTIGTALFEYEYTSCSSITFKSQSPGINTYHWDFGDGTTSDYINPEHVFAEGKYVVTFKINPNTLCADSIQKTITVTGSSFENLLIPNVFTPNGDNMNDEFRISGLNNCKEYNLIIYNRWGVKLFETTSPSTVVWNGGNGDINRIIDGVYFYILTSVDGSDNISGTVSVIR